MILNTIVSVVSQAYTVNLWEENVLRGNSAILKCHIPSFVAEYVTITSWIISEGEDEEIDINLNSNFSLGKIDKLFASFSTIYNRPSYLCSIVFICRKNNDRNIPR